MWINRPILKRIWHAVSVFLALALLLVTSYPNAGIAQVASSTNYKMLVDSPTNCGGGFSSSSNYKLFDTLCEQATDTSSSTSYAIQSGFQATSDLPSLSATYSSLSINFGDLTQSRVASTSITVSVTTNAQNGYFISILSDGNFRRTTAATDTTAATEIISQVTDGSVSIGGNEYGVSTSATDVSIPTSTPRILNTNTSWASGEQTTLTFKIGPSETNSPGSYTQNITLIVTSTF